MTTVPLYKFYDSLFCNDRCQKHWVKGRNLWTVKKTLWLSTRCNYVYNNRLVAATKCNHELKMTCAVSTGLIRLFFSPYFCILGFKFGTDYFSLNWTYCLYLLNRYRWKRDIIAHILLLFYFNTTATWLASHWDTTRHVIFSHSK